MWSPEWFVSHGPKPAVWPKGGMLSSADGPCLSPSTKLRINSASGSAFPKFASVLSHEARRGVNGFGAFCRNKRASPAVGKPGNTEHYADMRVGETIAIPSSTSTFSWNPQDGANRLGWVSDASLHRIQPCHSRQARSILRQQAG